MPPEPMRMSAFNDLPSTKATQLLHTCCGCNRWASELASRRPFQSREALFTAADKVWHSLAHDEWLEAFSHHPRIGQTNLSDPKHALTADTSRREQSGMAAATDQVRREFLDLNQQYEHRFGHVFLICATGKSADDMLAQLKLRLHNDKASELANAAAEQAKIIRLRLEKLIHP